MILLFFYFTVYIHFQILCSGWLGVVSFQAQSQWCSLKMCLGLCVFVQRGLYVRRLSCKQCSYGSHKVIIRFLLAGLVFRSVLCVSYYLILKTISSSMSWVRRMQINAVLLFLVIDLTIRQFYEICRKLLCVCPLRLNSALGLLWLLTLVNALEYFYTCYFSRQN